MTYFKYWLLFAVISLYATGVQACDICHLYIGLTPNNLKHRIDIFHRYRTLRGYQNLPNGLPNQRSPLFRTTHDPALHGVNRYNENDFLKLQTTDLRLTYFFSKRFNIMAVLPLYYNEERIGSHFTTSSGIADAICIANYYLIANNGIKKTHQLFFQLGVKLPTGKSGTDKQSYENNLHLQGGTQTFDILTGITHSLRYKKYGALTNIQYQINTTNKLGFRVGNTFTFMQNFFYDFYFSIAKTKIHLLPAWGINSEYYSGQFKNSYYLKGTGGTAIFTNISTDLYWKSYNFHLAAQLPVYTDLFGTQMSPRGRLILGCGYFFGS
jgi:hypothetical protein